MGADSHNEPLPGTVSSPLSAGDNHRPDTVVGGQTRPGEQQQFGGPLPTPQERLEPSRSQALGRQVQEPKGPQYKLQAKITGLERTGRKDPILRFDVHVRIMLHIPQA